MTIKPWVIVCMVFVAIVSGCKGYYDHRDSTIFIFRG